MQGGDFTITDNIVTGMQGASTPWTDGIGVMLANQYVFGATVTGNVVDDCAGFGIYVNGVGLDHGRIESNTVSRTTGAIALGRTGAADDTAATVAIVDNLVFDNLTAAILGTPGGDGVSGIMLGVFGHYGKAEVVNNTLLDNASNDIRILNGRIAVANNICHGSVRSFYVGSSATVSFVNFDNNVFDSPAGAAVYGSSPYTTPTFGTNYNNVDPLLDGEYIPLSGSPAVDTGDATYGASAGLEDYDGSPRVIGAAIDIGAQEKCADCETFYAAFDAAACTALSTSTASNYDAAFAAIEGPLADIIAADGCFTELQTTACVAAYFLSLLSP